MAGIGEQEIKAVCRQFAGHMRDYLSDINSGFDETEKDFKVSFNAVFNPSKMDPDAMDIKTEISFLPMTKIKDGGKITVGGRQGTLFPDDETTGKKASVLDSLPARMQPRHIIDIYSRRFCISGPGIWCTGRHPCYRCEGRDHADYMTFNERHERDQKLKTQTAPVEKQEPLDDNRRLHVV